VRPCDRQTAQSGLNGPSLPDALRVKDRACRCSFLEMSRPRSARPTAHRPCFPDRIRHNFPSPTMDARFFRHMQHAAGASGRYRDQRHPAGSVCTALREGRNNRCGNVSGTSVVSMSLRGCTQYIFSPFAPGPVTRPLNPNRICMRSVPSNAHACDGGPVDFCGFLAVTERRTSGTQQSTLSPRHEIKDARGILCPKRCTRARLFHQARTSAASASASTLGGLTAKTRLARGNPGGLFKQ